MFKRGLKAGREMGPYLIVWFGQFVSTIGSQLSGFALSVWIYQEFESITLFAINNFIYLFTGVIVSQLAGALIDRWKRKWVLIGCDTASALLTVLIWRLYAAGSLEIWHIYLTTFFWGISNTFQWPAWTSTITVLVPKEHFGRANGLAQISSGFTAIFTPILAGMLYLSVGLDLIFIVDIITFLFAITTLMFVVFPQPREDLVSEETKPSIRKEIRIGWRWIIERKGLYYYMLYLAVINFSYSLSNVVWIPMMLEMGNPQEVGFANGIIGAGVLIGGLIMSAWGGPKNRPRMDVILGIYVLAAFTMIGISAMPSLIWIGIFGAVRGVTGVIGISNSRAIWQAKTPAGLQGRVFASRRMIALMTTPIAALVAGPLVDKVYQPMIEPDGLLASSVGRILGTGPGRGSALAIFITGVLNLTAVLIALNIRVIRNVEAQVPDAELQLEETTDTDT